MPCEPKARLSGWIGLLLLVASAVAVWWVLDHWEHRAAWLRVEAPRRAVARQTLPLRVHLAPLEKPTRLCADLHRGTTRDASNGYLGTGGSKPVGKEGGTFDFEIRIPPALGARFVTGILFLTSTGSWENHTLVAATEVIPVSSNTTDKVESRLEPLRVQPPGGATTPLPHPAPMPRWLTALLFLIAAVAAWGGGPSRGGSGAAPGHGNRRWQLLAVAMALACFWELFGLESWLGALAREMARAADRYYPRVVFQKLVISVAIPATLLFFLFIRRVRNPPPLLLASFSLHLAISGVNLISWHPIDLVADLS